MNMIIGKKQIVLASLVAALGAAVYLNYQFAAVEGEYIASSGDNTVTAQEENYGDATFVDTKTAIENQLTTVSDTIALDSSEYFSEAKLTRSKSRDEAVEALKTMLSDEQLTLEQKSALTQQATDFAQSIEVEGKIENLLKAKGFTDCMVYYDENKVDVILKADDLLEEQVTQIRDVILEETDVSVQDISIVPIQQ